MFISCHNCYTFFRLCSLLTLTWAQTLPNIFNTIPISQDTDIRNLMLMNLLNEAKAYIPALWKQETPTHTHFKCGWHPLHEKHHRGPERQGRVIQNVVVLFFSLYMLHGVWLCPCSGGVRPHFLSPPPPLLIFPVSLHHPLPPFFSSFLLAVPPTPTSVAVSVFGKRIDGFALMSIKAKKFLA